METTQRTLGDNLRVNTRTSVVLWTIQQTLKFLLVPIIVAWISKKGYAIVVLAFSIMGYFTVHNFGLNAAFIKYTAECHAQRDYMRLSRLLSTGTAVGALISLVVLVAALGCTNRIVGFFDIEPAYRSDAQFVVACIAFVSFFTMIFGVFRATLVGLQRIDVTNRCSLAFSFVEFVGVALALRLGYGVRGVVGVYSVTIVAPLLVMAWFVQRYLPEVRITPLRASRDGVRSIVSLGGRMQLLGIVALLMSNLDKLTFTKYQGLAFAGAYALSRNLIDRVQGLPKQGFGALMAASADLHSREDRAKLSELFGASLRVTAVVSAYLFGFLAMNGDMIIRAYVGDAEYDARSSLALQFLCAAVFIHTLTGPGTSMLRGAGKPLIEMLYQGLTVALFLMLFGMARAVGNENLIILCFPTSLALASLGFLVLANRHFKAPVLCPFTTVLVPITAGPVAAALIRWAWDSLPLRLSVTRWTCLLAVVCMGAVYTAVFAAVAWWGPGLTRRDKKQLLRFVPFVH